MEALIKVLFIVTSHSEMGNTGVRTGWYLNEVAQPYEVFTKANFQIDFMSPKGGQTPMDPGSAVEGRDDPQCQKFISSGAINRLNTTMAPSQVNISDYQVIFYPGGHGPMFDLPNNDEIAALTKTAYESGAIVSAVCHGIAGFVPVRLSSGISIVKGQTLTSLTNSEEAAGNFFNLVPFLLETKLRSLGANFIAGPIFKPNVQDPGSAEAFKEDPVSQAFLKSGAEKLKTTMKPSDVDISKYKVIFYAGGHGPMFDLPKNEEIAKLCAKAYEGGAVVCAVCHGTVGLVPVKLSNGESIVKGQTITSFTNAEEEFVKLTEAMPFLLETKLKDLGGNFVGAENFQVNVQTSGRIVTGQNPPSAGPMAEKVVSLVKAA
uniref:Uncharacterized protein C11D3.13 n=1 Tax=Magallana gigas TaxID=29159 RepID=K1PH24_MAGGI